MPRGRKRRGDFNEKDLTKGQLRKLNALRKSLGDEIANGAFAEWLSTEAQDGSGGMDRNVGRFGLAIIVVLWVSALIFAIYLFLRFTKRI